MRHACIWDIGEPLLAPPLARLPALQLLVLSLALWLVDAKFATGHAVLAPKQALVVTKFCFDFDATCGKGRDCSTGIPPGTVDFQIYGGSDGEGTRAANGSRIPPDVHFALLDDEYFSFPEVSQVWGEANCTDVLRAAKSSFKLDWERVRNTTGHRTTARIVEKLKPRWWYMALVSCANSSLDLSYRIHMENNLRGWQSELSIDNVGIFALTFWACALFCGLAAAQLRTMAEWATRSRTQRWLRLHPALLLLTASALLAATGEAFWLAYYWHFAQSGEASELWALTGRGAVVAAKVLMQVLLMLLANGECVCTPDIEWSERRELVAGQALFGVLTFGLEVWGDSEHQNTTVEYIYDTRPGMVLVAFDLLWLYTFSARSWETMRVQGKERLKSQIFYRRYGPIFALWFASLPAVAALAGLIAAWIRFRAVLALNTLSHALALGALIYTFRPETAERLYELTAHEYEAVNGDGDELSPLTGYQYDDDVI